VVWVPLFLLRYKWTYLIAGLLALGFGAFVYFDAHPARPVEVDGTESSYVEVTRNGGYDHNELQLVGNGNTYTLNKTSFHPTLPDQVFKAGKMQIWIDSGTTTVIAITLYDENDENPVKYATDTYDNPASETSGSQGTGIFASVVGLILIGIFGLWFVLGQRRQSTSAPGGVIAAAGPVTMASLAAASGPSTPGLSPDGRWYWDGVRWRNVSEDGEYRWDGEKWVELRVAFQARGAPPPPPTPSS
jgi:hypothetical protein